MELTVGRKVWVWGLPGVILAADQPFDGSVCFVQQGGQFVNVSYADHNGTIRMASGVPLRMPLLRDQLQADPSGHGVNDHHGVMPCATWMPYQVRQASHPALGAASHIPTFGGGS